MQLVFFALNGGYKGVKPDLKKWSLHRRNNLFRMRYFEFLHFSISFSTSGKASYFFSNALENRHEGIV